MTKMTRIGLVIGLMVVIGLGYGGLCDKDDKSVGSGSSGGLVGTAENVQQWKEIVRDKATSNIPNNKAIALQSNNLLPSSGDWALSFDGIDDYVEVPDSDSLDITGSITLEAWIKPNSVDATNDWRAVIYKLGTGGTHGIKGGCGFLVTENQKTVYFFTESAGVCFVGTDLTLGEWNHVVGTYDDTEGATKGYIAIYINGVLKDSGKFPGYAPWATDRPLLLGGNPFNDGFAPYEFEGLIDQVAIYKCALTAGDIWNHYQQGILNNSYPDDLVSYWALEEGPGNSIVYDAVVSSNNTGYLGDKNIIGDASEPLWVSLPKITSITPAKIYPGRQITISGSGFATSCQVKFTIADATTTVTPDSVSADGTTAIVTAPANIGSGNAAVTVLQGGLESNAGTVYIYHRGLPGIIEVLTDMIADPTITDTTYLTQAKTKCEAMVANLSATPPNYTSFLTNMSSAMDNIVRAAKALSPNYDIWYLANELVYVRTDILNAGSAHDHTTNLLQSPALLIIAKMETTSLGLGFDNLSLALQETNKAVEEYIFLDFQQYFLKLKNVDAYLATAVTNGVDTAAVSLIRSALATIGYNFFLAIYNQGVTALTGQGHTTNEINTQEWLAGLKSDIDAMNPATPGMTYPAFWDAARLTYTGRIGNDILPVASGTSPVPVRCGCVIRLMYVKGGPIIDGDVVKNDSVTPCGLKMALELVKQVPGQNGEMVNTEIRDIDEWEIICLAVNGLCGKVDKQDVSDYISTIQWTLTADTPDGLEEGVTDTTGRLETSLGKATVYYPPELKVGFLTPFKVTLKVTAIDNRQHSKSDKLEISYTISVKRTDIDVYQTSLTQKGDKNERNPDPVILKPGCGCQTQLKQWKVGENLAFDSPAGNEVEYIGVGSPAIILADPSSDSDRLKVDCAGLNCPVHTTEKPIYDVTYCTWERTSGVAGTFPVSTQGKQTTFVASAPGQVQLKINVTDSAVPQYRDPYIINRTYTKMAVKVDLNMTGVSENDEEKEGGYVALNDDDDNNNNTPDWQDAKPPAALEDDIVDLSLSFLPTGINQGKVILEALKGVEKINIWRIQGNSWHKIIGGTDKKEEWQPNQMPATLKLEGVAVSQKERDVELQLRYEDKDGKLVTCDKVRITVVKIIVHPINTDFTTTKEGRVLISTTQDNQYHTSVKTTKDDTVAQTQDGKIAITAYVKPDGLKGKILYFRAVSPDPDDRSSYEAGTAGGDNRLLTDPNRAGVLNKTNDTIEEKTINGIKVMAAEVELTFTNQYAGNNYQVEVSLLNDFSRPFGESMTLVAWKRIYLEMDTMYQKGATVTTAFTADGDSNDDVITVDNTDTIDTIAPTNTVEFFDTGGVTVTRNIIAKTTKTITVADLPNNLAQYSGVKLQSDNTVYSVSTHLLTQAYGNNTDGADGGTFVEFVAAPSGSENIPKYTNIPSADERIAFCRHWYQHVGNNTNVFQIVAAYLYYAGDFGITRESENISVVFTGEFSFGNNNTNAIAETVVHEIGHQFDVANAHVDGNAGSNNDIDGTDRCVMAYDRVRDNNIAEFDTDCIYDIRDAVDPR